MKQTNFRALTVTGALILMIVFVLVGFSIIPLGDIWFFLLVFGLFFALLLYSYLYEDRARAFKVIASKYHLNYTYFEKITNTSYKKNILTGEINGTKIELFDDFEYTGSLLSGGGVINVLLDGLYIKRLTIIIINNDIDHKNVLKGFFFGHSSIKKIEAILADIKDNNSSAKGGGEKR